MIAMFYWRMDNELEPTTAEATIPVFPLFSNCPDNTQDEFIVVEDLI